MDYEEGDIVLHDNDTKIIGIVQKKDKDKEFYIMWYLKKTGECFNSYWTIYDSDKEFLSLFHKAKQQTKEERILTRIKKLDTAYELKMKIKKESLENEKKNLSLFGTVRGSSGISSEFRIVTT